ncbi:hypothetical protein Hdeb2414_s0009g00319011 [Helianthus debilis subsp. tardiflorus]
MFTFELVIICLSMFIFELVIIKTMRMEPDGAVWGALLGACQIHKNVDLAEYAFDRVIKLEPTDIGYYVLL